MSPTAATTPRRKVLDVEVEKLWHLFPHVRGAVCSKLVQATVVAASNANNAFMTAATLPPMAADLDWVTFREYITKWLRKNEDANRNSIEVMVSSFKRARGAFATHVRWEFEEQRNKFTPFEEMASAEVERRYVEGKGECLFDAGSVVHELDLDSMLMFGPSGERRLRRKVTVVQATVGDAYARATTFRFERDLPNAATAVSWTFRTPAGEEWEHFNRYQSFVLETAFRESIDQECFQCEVGGALHVVVTCEKDVNLPDEVTTEAEGAVGRSPSMSVARRPPHIRRADDPANEATMMFSYIRRVLVPREQAHNSDVLWRHDCPMIYPALALHERNPVLAGAFAEFEATEHVSVKVSTLDDDDDSLYRLARTLIDKWAIPPICLTVANDLLRYEVLLEGMWVPMLPINNWIMQPTTYITCATSSIGGRDGLVVDSETAKAVFLFEQWLPYDSNTCSIRLPCKLPVPVVSTVTPMRQAIAGSRAEGCEMAPSSVLWCRQAEEKDVVVRMILRDDTPWLCSREVLATRTAFPRHFLEGNLCIHAPSLDAVSARTVMMWLLRRINDGPPIPPGEAVRFDAAACLRDALLWTEGDAAADSLSEEGLQRAAEFIGLLHM